MPNFNDYKTTSDAHFPKTGGVPGWDLRAAWNAWDTIIDFLAILWSWFFRAESTAGLSVTSSPMIYTAGSESEVIYLQGGAITAIEKKDSSGSWVSLFSSANCTIFLAAAQQLRITYTDPPTLARDVVGMFVNATGYIASVTLSASPATVTNSYNRTVNYYISGGAVSSITRNGVSITDVLPISIPLSPSASFVITYTEAPTVIIDA